MPCNIVFVTHLSYLSKIDVYLHICGTLSVFIENEVFLKCASLCGKKIGTEFIHGAIEHCYGMTENSNTDRTQQWR